LFLFLAQPFKPVHKFSRELSGFLKVVALE
jgi:hypothetical protein